VEPYDVHDYALVPGRVVDVAETSAFYGMRPRVLWLRMNQIYINTGPLFCQYIRCAEFATRISGMFEPFWNKNGLIRTNYLDKDAIPRTISLIRAKCAVQH
jgi:hypothetical protein